MVFQCEVCSKIFCEVDAFKKHVDSHEEKPHGCALCGEEILSVNELNSHIWSKHQDEEVEVVTQDDVTSFACKTCWTSFGEIDQCVQHIRIHKQNAPCELRSNNCAIDVHKIMQSPEIPFKCDICPAIFAHLRSYRLHKKKHDTLNGNQCDICDKVFPNATILDCHKKEHDEEESFVCKFCSATFTRKRSYVIHVTNTHSTAKRYQCEVCKKLFAHSYYLKVHRRVHTGERPFECEFCSETFLYRSQLKSHIKKHSPNDIHRMNDEPSFSTFKCDICNRYFGAKDSFFEHKKVHDKVTEKEHETVKPTCDVDSAKDSNGEGQFKCEMCPQTFKHRSRLTMHLTNNHANERPFKCDLCSKSFFSAGVLEQHKNIHSGVKPLTCKVCSEAFIYKCQLKEHCNKHFAEEPKNLEIVKGLRDDRYRCKFCQQCFVTKDTLEVHESEHKEDNKKSSKTKNRPQQFKCDYCNKIYSHENRKDTHIQRFHKFPITVQLGIKP